MVTAPARRALVREMMGRGLSERRALAVLKMSASSLRYARTVPKLVAMSRGSAVVIVEEAA